MRLTVIDTLILGNSAGGPYAQGGGIFISPVETFILRNSTIAGNSATGYGGGIYINGSRGTITNSIVALNDAASRPNILGSLSSSSGFNLIDTDNPGFLENPRRRGGWGVGDCG